MSMLRVPVTPADHIRGPENAPVTMVEYGDYECPFCGQSHPIVNSILKHFGDDLSLVYRHFPLTQVHPHAQSAAETYQGTQLRAFSSRTSCEKSLFSPASPSIGG